MGTFNWTIEIASLTGEVSTSVSALVDTGSSYSVFPANLLRDLGVSPDSRSMFEFGDGRQIEMDVGQIWVTINGRRAVTKVVFGEDELTYLLGSHALEGVLLGVDPSAKRLIPVNGLIN